MIDSIIVVGVLIHSALFHSVFAFKAAQMNRQHSIFHELMLYEFRLSQNICCEKEKMQLITTQ